MKTRNAIWSGIALLLSFGVLALTFQNVEFERMLAVLSESNSGWIIVLVLMFPLEQWVRAWKWRQILYDIQPVGTFRLFSAVMAGYFANMLIPVGVSPLVRAWLIARLENLKVSTVLMTTAIERFIDGIIFALIVGLLLIFATLPAVEGDGDLRLGLMASGSASLLLFAGLFVALFFLKRHLISETPDKNKNRFIRWLNRVFDNKFEGLGDGIAEGITWPKNIWQSVGVILASISMKLISTTHFLWAGLLFGIMLSPLDYLLIMVISGFAMIITRFIRLPGGGVIGSAFALKLLDVADEEALIMVLIVQASSMMTTAVFGAFALWGSGITILNIRQQVTKNTSSSLVD